MAALTPRLGFINPSIYEAAKKANLSPTGTKILNNYTNAYEAGIELNNADSGPAKKRFRELALNEQNQIKAIWGDKEYTKPDPTIMNRVNTVLGFPSKLITEPIIKIGTEYDRYDRARNATYAGIAAEANIPIIKPMSAAEWDKDAWNKAYDGKQVYNETELNKLIKEYGPVKVKLAQGAIAGMTLGEIMQEESIDGKVNQEFLTATNYLKANYEEAKRLTAKVQLARFSFGRNVANNFLAKVAPEGEVTNSPTSKLLNFFGIDTEAQKIIVGNAVSGPVDAFALIFGDPVSYYGGIVPRGLTVAGRIERLVRAGDATALFRQPQVKSFWDKDMGPLIEQLSKAPNPVAKTKVRREIAAVAWQYQNSEIQDYFVRAKAFNASAAERHFRVNIEDVTKLEGGQVDGISLFSNGIPFARRSRHITSAANRLIDATFNPNRYPDEALLNAKVDDFWLLASNYGMKTDFNATGGVIADLSKIEKDIKGVRGTLVKQATRSPQGLSILYGPDAIKSTNAIRLYASHLFSREVADVIAETYPKLSVSDQIVRVRGLFAMIMLKAGASPDFVAKELQRVLNDKGTFTTFTDLQVPFNFETKLSPYSVQTVNNELQVASNSGVQPRHLAGSIGPLDIKSLLKNTSETKLQKGTAGERAAAVLPVVGRSTPVDVGTQFVVAGQLYPRLALRTIPEEATTLLVALDSEAVKLIAAGKGREYGEFLTVFSGSKGSVGPFFKAGWDKRRKQGYNAISDTVRESIPAELAARKNIENAKRAKPGTVVKQVQPEDITAAEYLEELFYRTQAVVKITDPVALKDLKSLIINAPEVLGDFGSSLSAVTGIGGKIAADKVQFAFPLEAAEKALKELGGRKTKDFKKVDPIKLLKDAPDQLTFIHKNAVDANFGGFNTIVLSNGKTFDPSITFFTHNALKDEYNFATAKKELFEKLEISVKNSTVLFNFIEKYADTARLRSETKTDIQIAEIYLDRILLDLRQTFHGSKDGFNLALYNAIKANYAALRKGTPDAKRKWGTATKAIDQVQFAALTKDNPPVSEMNSQFDFGLPLTFEKDRIKEQLSDPKFMLEKLLETPAILMTQMDRVMNGVVRQPTVTVLYMETRKYYRAFEKQFSDQMYFNQLINKPYLNQEKLRKRTDAIADKHYAEISVNKAVSTLMKYVDNPAIQSNFAVSNRYLSRYYRAGEDFNRRLLRIAKEQPMQALFRMRLVYQGLEPRGQVFEDEKGDAYFVFPTDKILNGAVNPILKSLGLPEIYDNLTTTMKFSSTTPGLARGSSRPTLSNPMGMFSVKFAQTLLNLGPIESVIDLAGTGTALKISNELDDVLLGPQGGSLEWKDILLSGLPKAVQEIYEMYDDPDNSQKLNSALFQALAYNQAHGVGLPDYDPNKPNSKIRNDYVKNLRISVRNLVILNVIFGKLTGSSLQIEEGKDVSHLARLAGMKNVRAEFYDLVQGFTKTDPSLSNAYEQATAIWNAENPGMSIYTVSRDSKEMKVLVSTTKEFKNWIIENPSFIERYKKEGTAYIFAPRTGEFDSTIYQDLKSYGLVNQIGLEDYLDKIQVRKAQDQYYKIDIDTEEQLSNTAYHATRAFIISQGEDKKALLKAANPLLEEALQGDAPGVVNENEMLRQLKEIVQDPEAPLTKDQRVNMSTATDLMDKFIAYASSPVSKQDPNFSNQKKDRDTQLRKWLLQIAITDESVKEANRAVFTPILNSITRYESTAGGR